MQRKNSNQSKGPAPVNSQWMQALETRRFLSVVPLAVDHPTFADQAIVLDQSTAAVSAAASTATSNVVDNYLSFTGRPGGSVFPPLGNEDFSELSAGITGNSTFGSTTTDDSSVFSRSMANSELPPFYAGLIHNPMIINTGETTTTAASTAFSQTRSTAFSQNSTIDQPAASGSTTADSSATTAVDISTVALSTDRAAVTTAAGTVTAMPGMAAPVINPASMATATAVTTQTTSAALVPATTAVADFNGKAGLLLTPPAATGLSDAAPSLFKSVEQDLAQVASLARSVLSDMVQGMSLDLAHHELEAAAHTLSDLATFNWQSWQSATAVGAAAAVTAAVYLQSETKPEEPSRKTVFSNRPIRLDNARLWAE